MILQNEPSNHHGMTCLSLQNFPVVTELSNASQTGVSAPFSTGLEAEEPPMSVLTHPGHTAFILKLVSSLDKLIVNEFKAVFDIR